MQRVRWATRFNPVNCAAAAGRSAATEQADCGLIASRVGLLAACSSLTVAFATRAFRTYERSI